MHSINTTRLTNHVISTVYEGLLKLGTTGNESYSIYYDLDLLNYLLGTDYTEKDRCFHDLTDAYSVRIRDTHTAIQISMEKGRFRFTVPASSIPMILSQEEQNSFLRDLIELVKSHHFTIEDVKEVFARTSDDYTCVETNHPEFQYVLYFNHEEINQYKYCFTFDGCGGYYHRLLDYDYQNLASEEAE